MNRQSEVTAQAMRAEQARMHSVIRPRSVGASAVLAIGLVAVLWTGIGHAVLLAWLACVAGAIGLRVAVGLAHQRSVAEPGTSTAWLWRHRLCFAAHGIAWGLAGVVLLPMAGAEHRDVIVVAVAAITAGSIVVLSFDISAALLFAVPALAPTLHRLIGQGGTESFATVAMLLTLVAGSLLGARGSQLALRGAARLRETDHALAEKHHLLAQLLHSTPQGFWFIDTAGLTTDVNPAMCALLGRKPEDVIGHTAFEFFDGADLQLLRAEIAARQLGGGSGYEIGITRPDGTHLHCFNNATPIFDTQGRRVGAVGIWTDITQRRQAELALRTYELAANSITDMVSVVGEDLVYRMVNDAWCLHMGMARADAIGRQTLDVVGASLGNERRRALHECIEQQQRRVVRGDIVLPGLAGRDIETTYYPYAEPEQGVRCVVMVTRDITEQEQNRRQLTASADYLRTTLNATGDAIFASDAQDPNEPVRFANAQMLQMWGFPPGKETTLTPAEIIAQARPLFIDADAETKRIREIIEANVVDETRLRLRDGRVLLRRCIPARVADRTVRVWSFRDITTEERALQAAQSSDAEHRALLDAFPGHIGAIDQDFRYTFANARLAAVLGRPADDIVGRPMREVLGADRFEQILAAGTQLESLGQITTHRHHPATASRPAVDLEITQVAGPHHADGHRNYYSFGQDVTARKRAEEALIAAKEEAERANRAKSQFLSQMSHELRTPMNAILGYGQLLEVDPRYRLPDAQQGYVREILRGARHLLNLINEILDLGRIESGRLEVERTRVPLQGLAEECLDLMRPLALARGLQIVPVDQPTFNCEVAADRTRLKQVLLNLLSNAIKYNRPAGTVELVCEVDGGSVRLGVRDSGPGLSAAQQQRLFQPFERLDASKSGIEGTGIGLALSRRLVEAMGGEIGVDSEVGTGSLFWVRLPLA